MLQPLLREFRTSTVPLISCLTILATTTFFAATAYGLSDAAWLRPYRLIDPDHVHAIAAVDRNRGQSSYVVPGALFLQQSIDLRGIELGYYDFAIGDLESPSGRRTILATSMSPPLAHILGVDTASRSPQQGGDRILATRSFAQSVGRDVGALTFRGTKMALAGIVPDWFVLPGIGASPFTVVETQPPDGGRRVRGLARLPSAMTVAEAEGILNSLIDESVPALRLKLYPIRSLAASVLPGAEYVLGVVSVLFVLGYCNVIYVLLSSYPSKQKAWAVQLALGDNKWAIVTRNVLALMVVGAAAGLSGVIASSAFLSMSAADWRVGFNLPRVPTVDGVFPTVVAIVVSAALAGLVGIVPVLVSVKAASRISLSTLGWSSTAINRRRSPERWLLATEVLLASTLISIAGVCVATFVSATSGSGIRTSDVLYSSVSLVTGRGPTASAPAPSEARAMFLAAESAIRQVPGVRAVSQVDLIPYAYEPSLEVLATPSGWRNEVSVRRVSAEYFEVLGMELLGGRTFSSIEDATGPPTVALVSETLERQLKGANSAGGASNSTVLLGSREFRVVGVVRDVRDKITERATRPTLYVPNTDVSYRRYASGRGFLVRSEPGRVAEVRRGMESALGPFWEGRQRFSVAALDSLLVPALRAPKLHAWSGLVLGGVAAFLTLAGTFATCANLLRRRRHESVVRLAVGATHRSLLKLYVAHIMLPVLAGGGLSLITSYWFIRQIGRTLQLTSMTAYASIGMFSVASFTVVLGLSVVFATRKVADARPVDILRTQGH